MKRLRRLLAALAIGAAALVVVGCDLNNEDDGYYIHEGQLCRNVVADAIQDANSGISSIHTECEVLP